MQANSQVIPSLRRTPIKRQFIPLMKKNHLIIWMKAYTHN